MIPEIENPEINAMLVIDSALNKITDDETKRRVLRWVKDKFKLADEPIHKDPMFGSLVHKSPASPTISNSNRREGKEIPGIAVISDNGDFKITVRDLKARSANDAAIRLVHIAAKAHHDLTGQWISSKNILVPLLRNWRLYDGNTRNVMSKHKGILRNGDEISLDFHAQNDADRYTTEALDETTQGTWSASGKTKKRSAGSDKSTDAAK